MINPISDRLKAIAQRVENTNTVADIGTDHAYIPIYLIQNQIAKRVIACDIKKGPAMRAMANINVNGLSDKIEVRIGDGLKPILPQEVDCIVIAGMGAKVMQAILTSGQDRISEHTKLILQPMKNVDLLRRFLYENGYTITAEGLVEDGIKIYTVIVAQKGVSQLPEEKYYHIGKCLIENKDPLLGVYLKKEIVRMKRAIVEMEKTKASHEKRQLFDYLISEYKLILKGC